MRIRYRILGVVLLIFGLVVPKVWSATQEQRVLEYGPAVDHRLEPLFRHEGVEYPPAEVIFVILKQEKKLEIYARGKSNTEDFHYITTYPILAASGTLGPKLREGDGQVPEGIYQIDSLNPNSHYHLALHVNYPNEEDRRVARMENRTQLGGNIMIHGNQVSIGCVAMGDPGAEDLFVLTARIGLKHLTLLFCPYDFRRPSLGSVGGPVPPWVQERYEKLKKLLLKLPLSTNG